MIQIHLSEANEGMIAIDLPISKSVANRELILDYLSEESLCEEQDDWPEDVDILFRSLNSNSRTIDLEHAGTAMRFSIAYHALRGGGKVLQGSPRMHSRPIGELVEALNDVGAKIRYLETEGYPPLEILESTVSGGSVCLEGKKSSQFITSLLLTGCRMNQGLNLRITPPISSRSYIDLTLAIMSQWGIHFENEETFIAIPRQNILPRRMSNENDWSAAAFFYGLVAQGVPSTLKLNGLKSTSAQGDREVSRYFERLGVHSEYDESGAILKSTGRISNSFAADLINHPDLAQPIAFTCAALGVPCDLTGLDTLKWKETDRLQAMSEVLTSVGCVVEIDEGSIHIKGKARNRAEIPFETYQDHRMAMSTAILTPALGTLSIKNEEVVKKSFPRFWEEVAKVGVKTSI